MSEDRCICCGEIVPEGRMVCPVCEKKAEKERDLAEELVSKWARGELVEPKKGKWISHDAREGFLIVKYSCSVCDYYSGTKRTNFCPNCGAAMEGEEDDG